MSKIPAGWKGLCQNKIVTHPPLCSVTWFRNWGFQYPQWMIDARFVPMPRPGYPYNYNTLDLGSVTSYASRYPGKHWMVLNEPDQAGQDDMAPAVAAGWYDDIYDAIKAGDATAQVGGIALTWIDENGETNGGNHNNYLPLFLAAISNPLDFHTVHDWVARKPLSGGTPTWDRLEKYLDYIQTLPKLQNKDVWLAEVGGRGIAYSDAASIYDRDYFAKPRVAWLTKDDGGFDNRIVRVAWYSSKHHTDVGRADDLYKTISPEVLSPLGTYWGGVNDMSELLHFVRAEKAPAEGDFDPLTAVAWENSTKSGADEINWNTVFGVPTAAKAVVVWIYARDGAAGSVFSLQATVDTDAASLTVRTQVANVILDHQGVVPVDGSGESYYDFGGVTWTTFYLRVVGWYV